MLITRSIDELRGIGLFGMRQVIMSETNDIIYVVSAVVYQI